MAPVRLTENFFLHEFTRSETAARHGIRVEVDPGSAIFRNLQRLCIVVLQPLRDALGPVFVTSGYRPAVLNSLIGGSPLSDHIAGRAADVVVLGYAPLAVCHWISSNLPFAFHQLIHEFGRWTHVSIAPANAAPRNERLTAYKAKAGQAYRTVYVRGLYETDGFSIAGADAGSFVEHG